MSLQQAIEKALGTSVKVRAGAPGSLRVLVNGKEIYSKKDNPDSGAPVRPDAIIERIRQAAAATT